MTVLYHPKFATDIRQYAERYRKVSPKLGTRFRLDVDEAIAAIKSAPTAAGHYVNTGSSILREVRRRNLKAFPFFVLYGVTKDQLLFGSVIPSASDPLAWLKPFDQRPDMTG